MRKRDHGKGPNIWRMRKPCDLLHVLITHSARLRPPRGPTPLLGGKEKPPTSEDEEAEPLKNETLTFVQKNEDEVGQILHLSEPSFPRLLWGG